MHNAVNMMLLVAGVQVMNKYLGSDAVVPTYILFVLQCKMVKIKH